MAKQRRFEYRDATSEKFWCIELNGSNHTVVYGRIGSKGQTKTKEFPSPEKAKTACQKLIDQKTGKGYKEVGSSSKKKPTRKPIAKKSVAKKPTKKTKTKTAAKQPKSAKRTSKKVSRKQTAKKSKQFLVEVKAELPIFNFKNKRTKDPVDLKLLDGFMHTDDSLLEYADDFGLTLSGGFVRCELDKQTKKLFIITDYDSPVEISKSDLKRIKDDTVGQWSDGVGEGCFDDFCETSGFGVETCLSKVIVSQTKGLAKTPSTWKPDQKKLVGGWKKAMVKNQPKGSKKEFKDLLLAIYNNKIRKVESLLGKVNLNHWQNLSGGDSYLVEGQTPLTCAVEQGHSKLACLLLDHGAEPEFPREDEDAPIHCCKNKECVKLILDSGVSASAKSKKYDSGLPLHRECILNDKESVKLLIKHGANPNAKNDFKKTPLELAAGHSFAGSVKVLLDAGAKLTEEVFCQAASSVAYDEYEEKEVVKLIKLLLKSGAKVTKKVIFGAMDFTSAERLKALLSTGFDANHAPWAFYSNSDKKRLLELAAENGTEQGLVAILLKHGADPNLCPGVLDLAIDNEDEKMVRQLLKAGARANRKQVDAAKDKLPKLAKLMERSLK